MVYGFGIGWEIIFSIGYQKKLSSAQVYNFCYLSAVGTCALRIYINILICGNIMETSILFCKNLPSITDC